MLARVDARHHDVRAFHVAHARRLMRAGNAAQHLAHPRPGGIDNGTRVDPVAVYVRHVLQFCGPDPGFGAGGYESRARRDHGPEIGCATRVQNSQSRIIDAGVGIRKTVRVGRLEPGAQRRSGKALVARFRQAGLAAEKVIQEQSGADHPARPQMRFVWQHEPERLDQVRRGGKQNLALTQCFAHQAEFVVLQVAQPAMNQLGAPLRGGRRQVALLD